MRSAVDHVLFYVDSSGFAGAEESLQVLIAHLPTGVAVTAMGPRRPTLERLVADRPGARIVVSPPLANRSDWANVATVWRRLRGVQSMAVHLNKTEVADLRYVELLLWLQRRRVVSIVHHVEPPVSAAALALSRFLARRSSAVVAVGDRLAAELGRILGLRHGAVVVVPNALPAWPEPTRGGHDGPAGRDGRGGRGTDPVTVGVLARLVAHKGVDDVVAAVARHPSMHLLIGGDGPERRKLEQQVERLGMTDRVRFAGWVQPDEVLGRCDLLVSAARIEGHPMTLLDCRRRGLPVVAADVGGVSSIVVDGSTGLLVPPSDIDSLSAAIGRLAEDAPLRAAMGRAAVERARRAFSPEAMAAAYCRLYAATPVRATVKRRRNREVIV